MRWLLLLLLLITGCAGDICKDIDDGVSNVHDVAATCGGSTAPSYSKAACDSGIDLCSDREKDALQAMADCLQRIEPCDATSDAWQEESARCILILSDVRDSCLYAALGAP